MKLLDRVHFLTSLGEGRFPKDCKLSHVIPILNLVTDHSFLIIGLLYYFITIFHTENKGDGVSEGGGSSRVNFGPSSLLDIHK